MLLQDFLDLYRQLSAYQWPDRQSSALDFVPKLVPICVSISAADKIQEKNPETEKKKKWKTNAAEQESDTWNIPHTDPSVRTEGLSAQISP